MPRLGDSDVHERRHRAVIGNDLVVSRPGAVFIVQRLLQRFDLGFALVQARLLGLLAPESTLNELAVVLAPLRVGYAGGEEVGQNSFVEAACRARTRCWKWVFAVAFRLVVDARVWLIDIS